jgi:hypothetical protein
MNGNDTFDETETVPPAIDSLAFEKLHSVSEKIKAEYGGKNQERFGEGGDTHSSCGEGQSQEKIRNGEAECDEKSQERNKDSSCGGGDNQEKIKNRTEGCDQKYQENKTDLLTQEENSSGQDTSGPLKEEVALHHQIRDIPKDFRHQGADSNENKSMAIILPYQPSDELSQPGQVEWCNTNVFFLGGGRWVFDPGGERAPHESLLVDTYVHQKPFVISSQARECLSVRCRSSPFGCKFNLWVAFAYGRLVDCEKNLEVENGKIRKRKKTLEAVTWHLEDFRQLTR